MIEIVTILAIFGGSLCFFVIGFWVGSSSASQTRKNLLHYQKKLKKTRQDVDILLARAEELRLEAEKKYKKIFSDIDKLEYDRTIQRWYNEGGQ